MNKTYEPTSGGPRFPLGNVVATPDACALLADHNASPADFLDRHSRGDWGDLCPTDKLANDLALQHGGRLFSAYDIGNGKLWCITEASRESTCLLIPENY